MIVDQKHADAAGVWNEHEGRADGERIVGDLTTGLRILTNLFFARIHVDVEREFGADSMLMPIWPMKSEQRARREIDIFAATESAICARENDYLSDEVWFATWLAQLRLDNEDDVALFGDRWRAYNERDANERQRAFAGVLVKVFREATRAPGVLHQLFPLAVNIVTSLAFDDTRRAQGYRSRQASILTSIGTCGACHGQILDVSEQCQKCGNPLWNYHWLTADY